MDVVVSVSYTHLGEVGVFHAVLTMLRRQTEVPMKGILRVKVDAPMLEERIELLLCRPILRIELVNVVIRHVKRLHIPFRLANPDVPVSDGMVQQPVTDKVCLLYTSTVKMWRSDCSVFRGKVYAPCRKSSI